MGINLILHHLHLILSFLNLLVNNGVEFTDYLAEHL